MFRILASLVALAIVAGKSSQSAIISGKLVFPDGRPFNSTTRVSLNHGELISYSRTDGTFTIYDVPPGIHSLDVDSLTHHFSQIKIQLLAEEMNSPKCLEYVYPGAQKKSVPHPFTLTAMATYDYFEARKGFSFFSILRNPMVLMMGFGAVLMFYMPKLMEGLEPEERERMKQQMEMQQDPTKMLSSLFGGEEPPPPKSRKNKKS